MEKIPRIRKYRRFSERRSKVDLTADNGVALSVVKRDNECLQRSLPQLVDY